MKTARLDLRITPELLKRVDEARGDVSRTRWVERAIERALAPEPAKSSNPRAPAFNRAKRLDR